jgi:serine/threonine protein kinase
VTVTVTPTASRDRINQKDMVEDLSRHEATVGRYMLFGQIGAGGMACVHLGRRVGPAGFSRLVAIKRLHPHLGKQREFVHAFLDEARIAARVSHPNVVSIDDVVMDGDEVLLVMDYVNGRSLSFLAGAERAQGRSVPPPVATAIALDMLHGLQAAHEAKTERGAPLGLVHRDVSPQNVLVGVDGVARVLDFGIAKALGRLQTTDNGSVKGKLPYMAPERLLDRAVTSSVDLYGAAIVIWELLAGERYFVGSTPEAMIPLVIASEYRHLRDGSLAAVDAVLERALRREPEQRHASCAELAAAIEAVMDPASRGEIMAWVQKVAGADIAEHADAIAEVERSSTPSPAPRSQAAPVITTPLTPLMPTVDDVRGGPPSTRRDAQGARAPGAREAEPTPRTERMPQPYDSGHALPSGAPHLGDSQFTNPAVVSTTRPSPAETRRSPAARIATYAVIAGSIAAAVAVGAFATAHTRTSSAATSAGAQPVVPAQAVVIEAAAAPLPAASGVAIPASQVPATAQPPVVSAKRGAVGPRHAPAAEKAVTGVTNAPIPPPPPKAPESPSEAPADRK